MKKKQPTELQEQMALARKLDSLGLVWCHVANEAAGNRGPKAGSILRKAGLKSGMPDNLIFSPPPSDPKARGVAIELKTRTMGRVSPRQLEWLEKLCKQGWLVYVANGYQGCLSILRNLGYIPSP